MCSVFIYGQVCRIGEVRGLRGRQFPEDDGPMAHPIRAESYIAIDNFYTTTVYEKGAEVIRMYETLLGRNNFRKGIDLYFERHDGQVSVSFPYVTIKRQKGVMSLSLIHI